MTVTKYIADILTIPNKNQRYRTAGDWFREKENGNIHVRVSNTNNVDYAFLTALHELIEQKLCEKAGISEAQIDAWRLTHENEDEPAELLKCPYREQHLFAEAIEKVLAEKIGVDWVQYGIALERAMDEKTPLVPKDDGIKRGSISKKALYQQTNRILNEQEG